MIDGERYLVQWWIDDGKQTAAASNTLIGDVMKLNFVTVDVFTDRPCYSARTVEVATRRKCHRAMHELQVFSRGMSSQGFKPAGNP
jgi:hypothetical protein